MTYLSSSHGGFLNFQILGQKGRYMESFLYVYLFKDSQKPKLQTVSGRHNRLLHGVEKEYLKVRKCKWNRIK